MRSSAYPRHTARHPSSVAVQRFVTLARLFAAVSTPMSESRPRRLSPTTVLLRGLLLVTVLALPLATFVFPAALAWRGGLSWPWALTLGLLAFPVVPLAWHAVGELRRRRKPAPDKALRRIDRLGLRTAASCLVVLGIVAVGWGSGAWQAVKHSQGRIKLAAIGSTGLDAEPVAALDPAIVALIPADVQTLFAIPEPIAAIDRLLVDDSALRQTLLDGWRDDCGVDMAKLTIVGGASKTEMFLAMHAPGLDPAAWHCMEAIPRAKLALPEQTRLTETPIPGGYQLTSAALPAEAFAIFMTRSGALVVTSAGWASEMKKRIAGHGGPIHLETFAAPLQRIAERDDVDAWAVTIAAADGWQDSSWWLSLADEKLVAGGTIVTADPAAATALADQARTRIDGWYAEMKKGGLDLGDGLGIDVKADASHVMLSLETDPMALFWTVWSSGMVQGMTKGMM